MHPQLKSAANSGMVFRDIHKDDLPLLFQLRRNPQLQALLLTAPDALDDASLHSWVKRRQDEVGGMFRIIEDLTHGGMIGYTQITQVHQKNRIGYGGIVLVESVRGRGLGRAVLQQLLQFGRVELGLRKLLAEIRSDNSLSVRLHVSLGYRVIGTLEKHFIDATGQSHDVLLFERHLGEV
jgi:RimJ/RimL family protein N-acetyltransferase